MKYFKDIVLVYGKNVRFEPKDYNRSDLNFEDLILKSSEVEAKIGNNFRVNLILTRAGKPKSEEEMKKAYWKNQ
jgi:hypothetical protein